MASHHPLSIIFVIFGDVWRKGFLQPQPLSSGLYDMIQIPFIGRIIFENVEGTFTGILLSLSVTLFSLYYSLNLGLGPFHIVEQLASSQSCWHFAKSFWFTVAIYFG